MADDRAAEAVDAEAEAQVRWMWGFFAVVNHALFWALTFGWLPMENAAVKTTTPPERAVYFAIGLAAWAMSRTYRVPK